MKPEDGKMRDILDIKEHLARRAEECERELEYLRRNIAVLDSLIKKSSFTRASEMAIRQVPEQDHESASPEPVVEPTNTIPITANSRSLAHAIVTPDELRVVIGDGIDLAPDTPPLKTFFVDRIIGGMRAKDVVSAQAGSVSRDSIIACSINEDAGRIQNITISNYRDKDRADEIINSVSWTLARMVENSPGKR